MNITPVSRRRILNGIIVILAALPIIYMFSLLLKHSVNVYWWDQVSFIDLMTKQSNGTLSLHDLWVQHNEHRILVPQAIELFVGKLTGFNSRVFVFMNFATVLASFALLLSMLRRTFTNNSQMVFLSCRSIHLVFVFSHTMDKLDMGVSIRIFFWSIFCNSYNMAADTQRPLN